MLFLCVGVLFVNVKGEEEDDEMDFEDLLEALTGFIAMCKGIYRIAQVIGWPFALLLTLVSIIIIRYLMESCDCCKSLGSKRYQRARTGINLGYIIWG